MSGSNEIKFKEGTSFLKRFEDVPVNSFISLVHEMTGMHIVYFKHTHVTAMELTTECGLSLRPEFIAPGVEVNYFPNAGIDLGMFDNAEKEVV